TGGARTGSQRDRPSSRAPRGCGRPCLHVLDHGSPQRGRIVPERNSMPPLHELGFQYQPIVSLSEPEAIWVEALARWHLPDGTVRGPLQRLPPWLSEQRQDVFTRFSSERVAATLAEHDDVSVSVNLSPAQVTHPQTLASLEGLLPDVRQRLRIELTEQRF